ncbi:MAG: hypothetical protein K9J25_07475 [Bacteroidales bacterium]|nr:hypothetical protein [Bacteroidales bacterium]
MYKHTRNVFKANNIIMPVFIVCLIFSSCTRNNQVKPLKPLSIATGNWEPYVGEDLENDGPVAQMISAVLIELGYLPVFNYYEWGFIDTHLETGYTGFPGFTPGNYTEVPGAEEGFKMLAEGKIDFLLEAKSAGRALVMSEQVPADASKFTYLGKASSPGEKDDTTFVKNLSFRIKFSPKVSDEFIGSINDAISTCTSTEYYRSLIARVNSPATSLTEAYLNNPGQSPVYAFSDPGNKDPDYVLPPNTRVVVIQWNRIFTRKIGQNIGIPSQLRSRVKILNGPLEGKVVWVENDQILISK